jgi:hypothetical protein
MNTPRNGHVRGTSPKRPGDLTGRILLQNQAQTEAERKIMNNPPVDIETIRHAAYEAGRDAGFSEGVTWVTENYAVYELEDVDAEPGTNEIALEF